MGWMLRIILTQKQIAEENLYTPYQWHQFSWKFFPHQNNKQRDFLLRINPNKDGCILFLLCQSMPDISWWPSAQIKEISKNYLAHRFYSFDIIANPTHCDQKSQKRLAILKHENLEQWLMRKGREGGFEVYPGLETVCSKIIFTKKEKEGTLNSVRFRGRLRVSDREKFIHTFYTGIGRAKAYGFGLLFLFPEEGI